MVQPRLALEGLRELQLLTSLQLLSLNGCRSVDSQCVGFAMVMPELHALHLDDTACNDVALLTATVLPKLCRLHARRTKISDHGLRVLSKRASLTDLAVGGCEELRTHPLAPFGLRQLTLRDLRPQLVDEDVSQPCRRRVDEGQSAAAA